MTATKKRRTVGAQAAAIRELMRECGIVDARELDLRSNVPADTIRNLLRGKTETMTGANLALLAGVFTAMSKRVVTREMLAEGRVR